MSDHKECAPIFLLILPSDDGEAEETGFLTIIMWG